MGHLATPNPQQTSLLEEPASTQLPAVLRLSVVGRLLGRVQLRIATDNTPWLYLTLQQWAPPGAVVLPVQARFRCTDEEAAASLVKRLDTTGWALLLGHGLRVAGAGADRALRMHQCTGVLPITPEEAGIPAVAATLPAEPAPAHP